MSYERRAIDGYNYGANLPDKPQFTEQRESKWGMTETQREIVRSNNRALVQAHDAYNQAKINQLKAAIRKIQTEHLMFDAKDLVTLAGTLAGEDEKLLGVMQSIIGNWLNVEASVLRNQSNPFLGG